MRTARRPGSLAAAGAKALSVVARHRAPEGGGREWGGDAPGKLGLGPSPSRPPSYAIIIVSQLRTAKRIFSCASCDEV